MQDTRVQFRIWPVAATLAWVAVVVLIGLAALVQNRYLGHAGLAMSAAAATLTIRCFICYQTQMMRNAFDLGRDTGRQEASGSDVSTLRLPAPPRSASTGKRSTPLRAWV